MKKLILILSILFATTVFSSESLLVKQLERTRASLLNQVDGIHRQIDQIETTLDFYYARNQRVAQINHELVNFYYDYQQKSQINLIGNISGNDAYTGQLVELMKNDTVIADTFTVKKGSGFSYKFKRRLLPIQSIKEGYTVRLVSKEGIERRFNITCTADAKYNMCGI